MRFSVLTPVFDPPPAALRASIDSVLHQSHDDWELILVDDQSRDPVIRALLAELATRDRRITVVTRAANGGISAASQDALDRAQGEFAALLDHDDLLTPNALERVARALTEQPEIDYVYSDEDKIDDDGDLSDRFFKPVWSPERLRSQMYTAHLSVVRTSLAREVGGFRPGFDGSQDHDLVLRVTEQARHIVHIPEVLYHWRVLPGSSASDPRAKSYAWDAGRRAVQDHVDRVGIDGTVDFGPLPGTYRIERRLPAERAVSIVIPTRGSSGLVWGQQRCFVVEAVRTLLDHTDHENLEIVVVADSATPRDVIDTLHAIAGDKLVVVPYAEPFNFSRKCNIGYLAARGDVIVLLNDDVEVVSDRWLENLCAPLEDPAVGLTGAKLFYSDGTVQHAGHLYDRNEYSHAFLGASPDSTVAFSALHIDRETSGVTAACAALRRETYAEIGGFCEDLPGNFNDVDFCFKLTHSGRRIVCLAHVELYHFESRTREPTVHRWEHERVINRWGSYAVDPYLPLQYGAPAAAQRLPRKRRIPAR
ncbi:MAG: glycosyl transferase family 2 [Pseudonocardiales bacterium]|nr:glycosyl transferase family 2 [Pseudonocardiales bacterium]